MQIAAQTDLTFFICLNKVARMRMNTMTAILMSCTALMWLIVGETLTIWHLVTASSWIARFLCISETIQIEIHFIRFETFIFILCFLIKIIIYLFVRQMCPSDFEFGGGLWCCVPKPNGHIPEISFTRISSIILSICSKVRKFFEFIGHFWLSWLDPGKLLISNFWVSLKNVRTNKKNQNQIVHCKTRSTLTYLSNHWNVD